MAAGLASLAAPINVFAAAERARKRVRASGTLDLTPSESVHSMGATVVRDIVLKKHFPGIKVFRDLAWRIIQSDRCASAAYNPRAYTVWT